MSESFTRSDAPSLPSNTSSSDRESSFSGVEATIKLAYDKQADQYDSYYSQRAVFAAENLLVQEWLEAHVRGNVLDVGAGTGLFLDLLEAWPEELYLGVDISDRMLEVAKRKHPRHHFLTGDMCDLADVEDGAVDTVVCLWAFQYAMRPYEAAAEFYRVLRPGGTLLLLANAPAHLRRSSYVHNDDEPPLIKWGASSLKALFRRFDLRVHGLNAFGDRLPEWKPTTLARFLKSESLLLSRVAPDRFMYLMMEGTK